jgi:hypothetical protein
MEHQILSDQEELDQTRPTLLTVLCILTFIGSSMGILGNVYSYSTAYKTAHFVSGINKDLHQNDSTNLNDTSGTGKSRSGRIFAKKMILQASTMATPENIRHKALGTIISDLITLLGALLMWKLRRSGFYLYIAGILIGISVPLYIYGTNFSSIGIASFTAFFGLLFIILYGLNIKSMK